MAYGDYDGPDKPNKGKEGGACNRQRCQTEPALWFNHGSLAWYCDDCRTQIQFDPINHMNWVLEWEPKCGHPMFETREMIDSRELETAARPARHALADQVQHYIEAAEIGEFPKFQRHYHRDMHRPADQYRAKRR